MTGNTASDDKAAQPPERPRTGPTLDLKATEVARESPPDPAPDVAPEPSPDPHSGPSGDSQASSSETPPPLNTRSAYRPWWTIAAAVAAGVPLFVVGLWLGSGPNPVPDNAQVQIAARLQSVEAALAKLQSEPRGSAGSVDLSALERRLDDLAASVRDTRTRADAASAAAERAQTSAGAGAGAATSVELEGVTGRIAALERSLQELNNVVTARAADDAGDRIGRRAVAASALRSAVVSGAPFAVELAAASATAPDASMLAPLEPFAGAGLPTVQALGRELSALTKSMRAAVEARNPDGGVLEKLQASAERLVRIRPVGELDGDDPSAALARIEVKAARSDISGALADLQLLPAAARAPAAAWIKTVQARESALAASHRFAQEAIAALGKPPK